MEKTMTLTDNEQSLIVAALNAYWHQANDKLLGQIGDMEREMYAKQKMNCKELMDKIGY